MARYWRKKNTDINWFWYNFSLYLFWLNAQQLLREWTDFGELSKAFDVLKHFGVLDFFGPTLLQVPMADTPDHVRIDNFPPRIDKSVACVAEYGLHTRTRIRGNRFQNPQGCRKYHLIFVLNQGLKHRASFSPTIWKLVKTWGIIQMKHTHLILFFAEFLHKCSIYSACFKSVLTSKTLRIPICLYFFFFTFDRHVFQLRSWECLPKIKMEIKTNFAAFVPCVPSIETIVEWLRNRWSMCVLAYVSRKYPDVSITFPAISSGINAMLNFFPKLKPWKAVSTSKFVRFFTSEAFSS